jgi:hypothetical protein
MAEPFGLVADYSPLVDSVHEWEAPTLHNLSVAHHTELEEVVPKLIAILRSSGRGRLEVVPAV